MFRSSRIRTVGPVSCIFNVTWLVGDVKEPTHLSKRVGHVVPGVVVWPCLMAWVGALHRDNLIAPFPLGQSCPRKIVMTMTITMTII